MDRIPHRTMHLLRHWRDGLDRCVPRRHQREPAAVSINDLCRLRRLITDSRHSFNLHSTYIQLTKPQHYPANKHSVTQLLSNPIGPNTILKTMV